MGGRWCVVRRPPVYPDRTPSRCVSRYLGRGARPVGQRLSELFDERQAIAPLGGSRCPREMDRLRRRVKRRQECDYTHRQQGTVGACQTGMSKTKKASLHNPSEEPVRMVHPHHGQVGFCLGPAPGIELLTPLFVNQGQRSPHGWGARVGQLA